MVGRAAPARGARQRRPTGRRRDGAALRRRAASGLCRTEHMFLGDDRQAKMQPMIMAEDEAARRASLAELEPLQRDDFEGLLAEMAGMPVTIRLLDPPLHEFLPRAEDLAVEIERRLAAAGERRGRARWSANCTASGSWRRPTRCSAPAAAAWRCCSRRSTRCRSTRSSPPRSRCGSGKGTRRELEIMIPLVDYERELIAMRELVERTARGSGRAARRRAARLHRRHDDRAAARLPDRRPVGRARGLLQLRHQRPDADGARLLARRLRGALPDRVPAPQDRRPQPLRDDRRRRASASW